MSPEADRQKATVQVKVQILEPDSFLRPEMNANVAFLAEEQPADAAPARPTITIPTSALVNGDSVFVVHDGRTAKRTITVRKTTASGVEIGGGLAGGEEIIVSPPQDLQDGAPHTSEAVMSEETGQGEQAVRTARRGQGVPPRRVQRAGAQQR